MNEVRASQLQNLAAVKAATRPADARPQSRVIEARASGETADTAKVEAREAVAADVKLKEVVAQMNDFIQREQRDLSFSVDEASGSTVIRVLDRESGDVIRQIPEEVFLRLAREAKEREAIQLINVQG